MDQLLARLTREPETLKVVFKKICINEVEVDEMWSYIKRKAQPRWLWHAIDHLSGITLAFVFGQRQSSVFQKLKSLLEPFGIKRFYTDKLSVYKNNINNTDHLTHKLGIQKIERKHLTYRVRLKRLARRTLCFSKSLLMHDTIIGLFINQHEFCL